MALSIDFIGVLVFMFSFCWLFALILVGTIYILGGRWSSKREKKRI